MELDAETIDAIVKIALGIGAVLATEALRRTKKEVKKVLADKNISEEQVELVFNRVDSLVPEKHKPIYRKLRSSWEDEEVTTEDMKRIIDALK